MPKYVGQARLTALELKNARGPCVLEDGAGLRLVVAESGAKRWVLRATVQGQRRDFGLGGLSDVGLQEARNKAFDLRRQIKSGLPPKLRTGKPEQDERLPAQSVPEIVTFEQAFETFFALKERQLVNPKHAALWRSTIQTYAYPSLRLRPVAEITTPEIVSVLRPIWFAKPETARRVLQRVKNVFQVAITLGTRERADPTTGVTTLLGTKHSKVVHRRALPYADVAQLLAKLQERGGRRSISLCLEWLILTASRSSEARLAMWDELDLRRNVWVVPAKRTKMRRDHIVPLAPRALQIISEMGEPQNGSSLIFQGWSGNTPISENTLNKVLRDLGVGQIATVHGFRSSFRDWAAVVAKARHEVAEASLAHAIKDQTVAAYLRADFLDERRELMDAWAVYCAPSIDMERSKFEPPADRAALIGSG